MRKKKCRKIESLLDVRDIVYSLSLLEECRKLLEFLRFCSGAPWTNILLKEKKLLTRNISVNLWKALKKCEYCPQSKSPRVMPPPVFPVLNLKIKNKSHIF